jgi:hypothetical protein
MKDNTPPTVHITRSRVAGDDDLMSSLRTDQARMLRKEKKTKGDETTSKGVEEEGAEEEEAKPEEEEEG